MLVCPSPGFSNPEDKFPTQLSPLSQGPSLGYSATWVSSGMLE